MPVLLLEIEPQITNLNGRYLKEISLILIAIYFIVTCMNRFVRFLE